MSAIFFAQIASINYEGEIIVAGVNDAKYFNLGDATIANDKLNIVGLNSGIYIVKITQGTVSITKKIVVN